MTPPKPPFAESLRSVGREVADAVGRTTGRFQEKSPLPVDVLESDSEYLVVFDAPGANPSDIQVRYESGTVEVRIDRFRPFREDFEMRFPGRGLELDGKAKLPQGARVDGDAAKAVLEDNGTLSVYLPKSVHEGDTSRGS